MPLSPLWLAPVVISRPAFLLNASATGMIGSIVPKWTERLAGSHHRAEAHPVDHRIDDLVHLPLGEVLHREECLDVTATGFRIVEDRIAMRILEGDDIIS